MRRITLVAATLSGAMLLSGCGTGSVGMAASGATDAPSPTAARTASGAISLPASPPDAVSPSATATQRAARPSNAVDWGQPAISDEDLDRAVRAAWADSHDVDVSKVLGDQLFLGLADRGELLVGAYQLWVSGGRAYVVVAQSEPRSEAVIVTDMLARPELPVVAAVVSRRTADVVASVAPGTTEVQYRPSSGAAWSTVDQDSRDLVFPRGASAGPGEALRTMRDGRHTVTTLTTTSGSETLASEASGPANALSWPARGSAANGPAVATVEAAYAKAMGARSAEVTRLFSGNTDSGVRYLIGQAWIPGRPAQTVGYVVVAGGEGELHIQPETPAESRVVALLVTELPGTSTDLLVVVPEPRTTQVSYRASGSSRWQLGYTDQTLDGVYLIDRAETAADDLLQITSGQGAPATWTVRVSQVLCDGPGCS